MKQNIRVFIISAFLMILNYPSIQAQSAYIPLNNDYYHWIERFEIKSGQFNPSLHSHLKPFQRKTIANLADTVWSTMENLSEVDKFNLDYLKQDSWEWSNTVESDSRKPILKALYKKKSDFYSVQVPHFDLHINPVLHGFVGYDKDNEDTPYMNTRGLELRGSIAKKVGFYTYFTDTQATFPTYITQKITELDAIPGEGFYKREIGANGVDFLTARGYITFDAIKNIMNIQFGYDKNFIGNGYRSMVLSDFSSNYLFLKINTNIWKLNYQNIFGQMVSDNLKFDSFYPVKYFASHHLSLNITKNLNVGLFESIVFSRRDTNNINSSNGTYDFRYLNPLIFYRSIEQQAGSPDNANVGLDFKWNFAKHFSLYGQLLVDELIFSEIRSGKGWRGNKQAAQIGLKYIDVAGISNLDLQAEANIARPYTYSHNFKYAEYSNYQQPLAHPLGANFYELIGIARFQPIKRLNLTGKMIYAKYGTDAGGGNWGQNIFLNNSTFEQEYGNKIGQGTQTNLLFLDFTASYQLKHNIFIDFKQIIRKLDSEIETQNQNSVFTSIVFRWNIPQRLHEF
jgi:hypothetical protein